MSDLDSRIALFSAQPLDLRHECQRADRDGDGRLNFIEFLALLDSLQTSISAPQRLVSFRTIDTNRDGHITATEFIAWWRAFPVRSTRQR
jgi:Ca2+-binding EF-hand superfamily protein